MLIFLISVELVEQILNKINDKLFTIEIIFNLDFQTSKFGIDKRLIKTINQSNLALPKLFTKAYPNLACIALEIYLGTAKASMP